VKKELHPLEEFFQRLEDRVGGFPIQEACQNLDGADNDSHGLPFVCEGFATQFQIVLTGRGPLLLDHFFNSARFERRS
jgi:hypothetical protein